MPLQSSACLLLLYLPAPWLCSYLFCLLKWGSPGMSGGSATWQQQSTVPRCQPHPLPQTTTCRGAGRVGAGAGEGSLAGCRRGRKLRNHVHFELHVKERQSSWLKDLHVAASAALSSHWVSTASFNKRQSQQSQLVFLVVVFNTLLENLTEIFMYHILGCTDSCLKFNHVVFCLYLFYPGKPKTLVASFQTRTSCSPTVHWANVAGGSLAHGWTEAAQFLSPFQIFVRR